MITPYAVPSHTEHLVGHDPLMNEQALKLTLALCKVRKNTGTIKYEVTNTCIFSETKCQAEEKHFL